MPSANEILDRLRLALEAPTDKAFAERLGVSPSTVATWRRRDSTPYEECIRVAAEAMINLHWLFTGDGPQDVGFGGWPVDPEVLAIALGLKKRWAGEEATLSTLQEAALIHGYYLSLSKRYVEMNRMGLSRQRVLAALRQEFALPLDPGQAEELDEVPQ